MFKWLGKLFGFRSAVESRRENPVLVATVATSAQIYEQIPLRQYIDVETSEYLAREYYLEINAVCNAPSPQETGREKLVQAVLRNALYQVLVIPAEPESDDSGLRALAGISGELGAHIGTLATRNIALRSDMHGSDLYKDDVDPTWLVEAEYWKSVWLMKTLDAARRALQDSLDNNDWLRPFIHAACANQENLYRIDLDLPSAFDDAVARDASTAYSIFTDIVVSGARDPLAEWLEYHKGLQVPMPGGIDPASATSIQQVSSSQ